MPKNTIYPAWRPDKVVTQELPNEDFNKPYWKATTAEIVGREATPSFAAAG